MRIARTCILVDSQTEYLRCQDYALHFMGPARYGVLWTVCWNRVKPSLGSVWNAIDAFELSIGGKNGHSTKRDTTKLSSSITMPGDMSQDPSRHTSKNWNATHRTLQTLLLPTTISFDRWHMPSFINISTLIKTKKLIDPRILEGSPVRNEQRHGFLRGHFKASAIQPALRSPQTFIDPQL